MERGGATSAGSRARDYPNVQESVLDRLLDDEPERTEEKPDAARHAADRLRYAIRRDLEWLLNTRTTWVDDAVNQAHQAARSIATFGIDDYSHENLGDTDARIRLKLAIEHAIALFEPRLTRVSVHPETVDTTRRALRLRIEAVLDVKPLREPVRFDTFVENGGATKVEEG